MHHNFWNSIDPELELERRLVTQNLQLLNL
jgi:hypothetical protein